ncbi:hypothetical protein BDF19DRAFT_436062, partial [Syncephalis fuscata]
LYSILGLLYLWYLYQTRAKGYFFCLIAIIIQTFQFGVQFDRGNIDGSRPVVLAILLSVPTFYSVSWARSMRDHIDGDKLHIVFICLIGWLLCYSKTAILASVSISMLNLSILFTSNWAIVGLICHILNIIGVTFNGCVAIWYLNVLPKSVVTIYEMKNMPASFEYYTITIRSKDTPEIIVNNRW